MAQKSKQLKIVKKAEGLLDALIINFVLSGRSGNGLISTHWTEVYHFNSNRRMIWLIPGERNIKINPFISAIKVQLLR